MIYRFEVFKFHKHSDSLMVWNGEKLQWYKEYLNSKNYVCHVNLTEDNTLFYELTGEDHILDEIL